MPEHWSREEIEAVVVAYFDMLDLDRHAKPFVKADVNRALRAGPLVKRSKGSVDYKLSNVSAILREAGLPWLRGYTPYPHVQAELRACVLSAAEDRGFISPDDFLPTDDDDELHDRARRVRARGIKEKPIGSANPQKSDTKEIQRYKRLPAVIAWVLDEASGFCELCGAPAPFEDRYGQPFLEVHHVRWLSKGGPDTTENAVALCPNCHKLLHHSADREAATERLFVRVPRLVRETTT